MPEKHLSSAFDAELGTLSSRVLAMGGLVEAQVALAMQALGQLSVDTAQAVLRDEDKVNALELQIDADLSTIIARRQPTARDLRLLLAIARTTANLERVGDEAARVARMVQRLAAADDAHRVRTPLTDLDVEAQLAMAQLRKALDALARLDVAQALEVLRSDDPIDRAFEGLMRKLITYMMEDPRTISSSIDLVFVAKAIERIGDHAKNLAEAVIYIVKGADVRHHAMDAIEDATR